MSLSNDLKKIAQAAKKATRIIGTFESRLKNKTLNDMAAALIKFAPAIKKANLKDLERAKKLKLPTAFIDRLTLDKKRIKAMADSLKTIARLDDPVGGMGSLLKRPNGLLIGKVRVPIGLLFIIYESRPNVTSDCIGLSLKSGNGVILRGGSEAINSNKAIFNILKRAALRNGYPKGAMNMIDVTDRKAVDILLGMEGIIDLVMPRGGESLIREVTRKSLIPVIKHYKGVCHVYVDKHADLKMAEAISFNAKVQRPGVCNAMETLLVHKDIARRFLPSMAKKFIGADVELRGCTVTKKILKGVKIKQAKEADWSTEYLDLILSVKVVNSLNDAIEHVNTYGTSHSDAIITENGRNAAEFLKKVDSSSVYVNASTRFTDGFEFGKGAEIGISTDKLHARGPVGLEELTIYKYVIFGNGQIRK